MRLRIHTVFVALLCTFFAALDFASAEPEKHGVQWLSLQEYRDLSTELSKKVDLFSDIWATDPKAEFYGGTSRDFLYWVKGQFRGANSRRKAEAIRKKLLGLPAISVEDFIFGESDVDVLTSAPLPKAEAYGIRKFDKIPSALLDAESKEGRNERLQGNVPVEKIRLNQKGFDSSWGGFKDGVEEIYRGKLTIQFAKAQDFKQTQYAANHENHPILLVTRYLRQVAMDYYREQGQGAPGPELIARIDDATQAEIRKIVREVMEPATLAEHFKRPRFVRWLNASIQKAYRSYTNPTAANELFKSLGLLDFIDRYAGVIEPINGFLFAKSRDRGEIEAHLREYHSDPKKFYSDTATEIPGLKAYHGTRDESAFRNILFQNFIPSAGGSAGMGTYAVSNRSIPFATSWGGDIDRVVELDINPKATLADIKNDTEARRVYLAYLRNHPRATFDDFSDYFGVDALRYDYGHIDAFVFKNSDAIVGRAGHTRKIMPFLELLKQADTVDSLESIASFAKTVDLNRVRSVDKAALLNAAASRSFSEPLEEAIGKLPSALSPGAQEIVVARIRRELEMASAETLVKVQHKVRELAKQNSEKSWPVFEAWADFARKRGIVLSDLTGRLAFHLPELDRDIESALIGKQRLADVYQKWKSSAPFAWDRFAFFVRVNEFISEKRTGRRLAKFGYNASVELKEMERLVYEMMPEFLAMSPSDELVETLILTGTRDPFVRSRIVREAVSKAESASRVLCLLSTLRGNTWDRRITFDVDYVEGRSAAINRFFELPHSETQVQWLLSNFPSRDTLDRLFRETKEPQKLLTLLNSTISTMPKRDYSDESRRDELVHTALDHFLALKPNQDERKQMKAIIIKGASSPFRDYPLQLVRLAESADEFMDILKGEKPNITDIASLVPLFSKLKATPAQWLAFSKMGESRHWANQSHEKLFRERAVRNAVKRAWQLDDFSAFFGAVGVNAGRSELGNRYRNAVERWLKTAPNPEVESYFARVPPEASDREWVEAELGKRGLILALGAEPIDAARLVALDPPPAASVRPGKSGCGSTLLKAAAYMAGGSVLALGAYSAIDKARQVQPNVTAARDEEAKAKKAAKEKAIAEEPRMPRPVSNEP